MNLGLKRRAPIPPHPTSPFEWIWSDSHFEYSGILRVDNPAPRFIDSGYFYAPFQLILPNKDQYAKI